MMIFETLPLNALDFLALLAGASFEEVEADLKERRKRGGTPCLKAVQPAGLFGSAFFFRNDDRFFLEVLYLKLSFLKNLIKTVFSREEIPRDADFRFSLDRIWVELPDSHTLSPLFWNFRVMAVDLDIDDFGNESSLKLPVSDDLCSLGMVWFHTLLANKKQDLSRLSLSPVGKEEHRDGSDPAFSPIHIFWNPEGRTVPEEWYPLWKASLDLGWSLYQKSFQEWSREVFWGELDNLREAVKRSLFSEKSIETDLAKRPKAAIETMTKDEALHNILVGILNRWPTEANE
ncbi:MAG: hypothetical protein EHM36_10055, partial [Deltaproteobacteria bacterium]